MADGDEGAKPPYQTFMALP